MRLNRFLALAGLASRRGAEELILAGRVVVNGEVCQRLATQIVESDTVKVDGKRVQAQNLVYLLLNKPSGYLTTREDEQERKTVYDLLPRKFPKLAHVGRLDKESEGLILLTNDGDLSLRLTHPKYKLEKEYLVTIDRELNGADIPKFRRGVYLEEGRARFESIFKKNTRQVRVILTQGYKRQIRRVFAALDYKVRELRRIRIGPLMDLELKVGEFRFLNSEEVALLKRPPAPKERTDRWDASRSGKGSMRRPFSRNPRAHVSGEERSR
jgi:23S rRNA pseudouridine2605 synthase